ncbi:MAG TPA: DUF5916 domain-containing protein [Candidatus Saccharimonadaceae bacterium]|jgi:hypothetical protein|nr:DUF5916 domain-containing protein [Candidatus Saccharimonadaceae bacterium]
MRDSLLSLATTFALSAALMLAGAPHAADAATTYRGSAHELNFQIPRVAQGPVVDGSLDDAVWSQAAVLDSFVQRDPREGMRDTLGTQCLVMYDDHALYVGFRCKDRPRDVRATITNRDAIDGDWVGIALDTYHDQRKSYLFIANPRGIQTDGIDQLGSDTDLTPDFLYTSHGRMTSDGYEVEMAIPFKSLRFPPRDSLVFGVDPVRRIDRVASQLFWAPITRDRNTFADQFGVMQGIAGVRPGRNLQIIPSVTDTRLSERQADGFHTDNTSRVGASIKYGLTSGTTADVAITPDFSQVEADAGVVDINQRFAIFFPEKRPFFLEGSEIFTTPLNLVYTRRIADPLYGVKVTGKMGATSVGVLQAADRSDGDPVATLPDRLNPYLDDNSEYSIARFKQDLFKSSSVGVLLGERRQDESYNRGLGLDGRFNFLDHYTLLLQRVESWARQRDLRPALAKLSSADSAALDPSLRSFVGARTEGDASYGQLSRDTKSLSLNLTAQDISPLFAADMGFIPRTDQIDFRGSATAHYFGAEKAWWTALHPHTVYERTYDHHADRHVGRLTDDVWNVDVELDLPRNSYFGAGGDRFFTYFNGRQFPDQQDGYVYAGSAMFQALKWSGSFGWGDEVIFEETAPGKSMHGQIDLNPRFSPQLDADLTVLARWIRRRADDTHFADVVIPRLRVTYQASKELSFRGIAELTAKRGYDALGDLTAPSRHLSLDFLAGYQTGPGTVFYLGYGSLHDGATNEAMVPTTRNAFAKISYLWQI